MVNSLYEVQARKLLDCLYDRNLVPEEKQAKFALFVARSENNFLWDIMVEATEDKELFSKMAREMIRRLDRLNEDNRYTFTYGIADYCNREMFRWRMKQRCPRAIAVRVSLDVLARECLGTFENASAPRSFSSPSQDQIANRVHSTLRLPIALMFIGLKISLSVIVCNTTIDLGEEIRGMLALPLPRNRTQKRMTECAYVDFAIIAGEAAATVIGSSLLRIF